ncbi:hypothetical protein BS78_03G179900 [Paspalum vaginatum]|nr:hypothetical protein BS78_03G179900 [Paspalum vaginatum]
MFVYLQFATKRPSVVTFHLRVRPRTAGRRTVHPGQRSAARACEPLVGRASVPPPRHTTGRAAKRVSGAKDVSGGTDAVESSKTGNFCLWISHTLTECLPLNIK